jgi:AcrR family transcriptional regulator
MGTHHTPLNPSAPAVRERAHAARNRKLVLEAAKRLIAERGVDCVTMDDVAREAGVGKGTVYRRFGDRAGLAIALLDERERELQDLVLRGPPPLGPGAPPAERLAAFLEAQVDVIEPAADLFAVAERGAAGYRSRVHASHRLHLEVLLRGNCPDERVSFLADALLAPISADLYLHLRRERGMSVDDIKEGLRALVESIVARQ